MSLERETILLTRKQRKILQRRILHRYHDLGEREFTPAEREQIYSKSTGIPQQIVDEEIERIKLKPIKIRPRKIRSGDDRIIDSKLLSLLALQAAVIIGCLVYVPIRDSRYQKTYTSQLVQYADTNEDGIVDKEEKDKFNYDLLKDKGVVYNYGEDLKQVAIPKNTLIKWLEEYKPRNRE